MTGATEHVPGLVTTVIPVHNRPVRLTEAVGSVLEQTYRPIEVVVVSDGSTDETESVAKGLEERHPGVVRVISRPNGGPGPARETGRLDARGEFIQYLDSDDLYLPEKTEVSVSVLRTEGCAGVAVCDSAGVLPDGRYVPRITHIDDAVFPGLLTGPCWQTGAALYRREVSDVLGPWTDLPQEEDIEYASRLGGFGARIARIRRELVVQRHHFEVRASNRGIVDTEKVRACCTSRLRVVENARAAGERPGSPAFRVYARSLFFLARRCAALGLENEARALLRASAGVAGADLRTVTETGLFRVLAAVAGWKMAARLAESLA